MKRAKRGLCVCLAACVCLMGGSLLTSCADDSMGIVGFDVESSVTAKYGSFYREGAVLCYSVLNYESNAEHRRGYY